MESSNLRRYSSATVLNNNNNNYSSSSSSMDGGGRNEASSAETGLQSAVTAHTTDSVKTDSDGTPYVPVLRGGNASSRLRPGSTSLMETLERERRETTASKLRGLTLTLPSRHSPVPSVGATCSTAPVEVPTITRALPKALRPKDPRRPSQPAATLLPTPVFSQQVHPLASAVDISDSVMRQRRSSFSDFRRGPSSAGDTVPAPYLSTTMERSVRSQQTTSGFRPPPEVVISGPDTIKRGDFGSRGIVHEPNPGLAMLRKPKEEMTEEERAAEMEMESARRSPTMFRLQSQEATTRSSSNRMSLQLEPNAGLATLAKIRERKQGKKPEEEVEYNPPEIIRSRSPVIINPPYRAAETRSSVTRMSLSTEPTPGLAGLRKPDEYISAEEEEARRSPIMRRIQNTEVPPRGNRMSLQFEPNPGLTMLRKEREENNRSPEVGLSPNVTTSARSPTTHKQEVRNGSGRMSFNDSKSFFSAYSSDRDAQRLNGHSSNPPPTKPQTSTVKQFSYIDGDHQATNSPRSAFTPMSAKTSKYRMFSYDDDNDASSAATTETKNYVTMTSSPPAEEDRKQLAEERISRNEPHSGYQTNAGGRVPSPYETAVRQEESVRTSSPMLDSWYDPIPVSPRVVIRNPHTPSTPGRDSASNVSPYSARSFNFSQDENNSLSGSSTQLAPPTTSPPALPAALPPTVVAVESERCETMKCEVIVESPRATVPSRPPVFTDSSVYTSVDVSYRTPSHLETVPDRDSDDDDDDRPPPELPTEAPPPIPSSSPPADFELSRSEADDDDVETVTTRWSTSKDTDRSSNVDAASSDTQQQPQQQQQQQQQQPIGWYARLSYHRATDSNITTDSGVGRSEHDCFSGHDSSADELDDSRSTTADLSSKEDCCRSPTQNPTSLALNEQRQMNAVSAGSELSSRISTDESPDSAIRSAGPLSPTSSDVITTDSEFEDAQLQSIDGMAMNEDSEELPRKSSVVERQTTTTTATTTVILHQLLAENGETLDNLLQCQQQQQQQDDEQREQAKEAESPRETTTTTTTWKLDDTRETQTFTTCVDNCEATPTLNAEQRRSDVDYPSPSRKEITSETVRSPPNVVTGCDDEKTTATACPAAAAADDGCGGNKDIVVTQRLPDTASTVTTDVTAESTVTAELPAGLRNIEIVKGSLGLGFCIEGGVGSAAGDRPVAVKRLFRNGPELGDLRAKDEIIAVNGVDFCRLSHFEAWNKLKALPDGTITITVRRN